MPSSRWLDHDEDRLPEGMTRVGYDADEQRYTFKDAQGLWLGEEGHEYGGQLTYIGPAPAGTPNGPPPARSERATYGPLAPFFLLICVVLLLLWKYLPSDPPAGPSSCGPEEVAVRVHRHDTCWTIAHSAGLALDELLRHNSHLNCDNLQPGQTVCLPKPQPSS